MTIKIGPYQLTNPVIAAPMAGVSDKPYRKICRQFGAAMTVSEMVTSQIELHASNKSRYRMDLSGEPEPIVVQLVGTDPEMLATAAQHNVNNGAQIIDINMGCPAKKVYKKAAGSALLENEPLVKDILQTVVKRVDVPVTVKIRTGANPYSRNAVSIAKIAEDAGVQAITIHGRTRECKFVGAVEYDTIAEVKNSISIPLIANGDIDSPEKALKVINQTDADAVMVGRAAQGQPWLFRQIANYLANGTITRMPSAEIRRICILEHLESIHNFYGAPMGVRLARKHIKWYLQHWETAIEDDLRAQINASEDSSQQLTLIEKFLFNSCLNLAA